MPSQKGQQHYNQLKQNAKWLQQEPTIPAAGRLDHDLEPTGLG